MSLMYSRFMLFTLYVVCKLVAIDAQNYRKCNPHHLEDCPRLAICTQTEKESNMGECKCGSEYVFNAAHNKNATDYCIHNPNVVPTVGVASSSSVTGAPAGSKTSSVTSSNEQPGAHHLVGGILIPVILVIVVIGVAFIVKRLNLVRRARDMFFSRRNRPFYEDVMMSNDNDDPPLI